MKAIIWTAYGPPEVLQLGEVEKPVPKGDEILIRIHATTVTQGDCELRKLKLPILYGLPLRFYVGFFRPSRIRILGQELAGEIEAVGTDVTSFKEGDPVFACVGFNLGAYAEYKCLPAASGYGALAIKPANLSFQEAAAVPLGGLEALHFIRKAEIRPGEKVLVYGAGGSIGTVAVQLAKHHGAEVTAVDSEGKLDMLRSIGADRVIDFTREDFTRSGATFDVIFDVVGKSPYSGSLKVLNEGGRFAIGNPGMLQTLRGSRTLRKRGIQLIVGPARQTTEEIIALRELIEAGEVQPVIDRTYPLEQIAEAHRYVESGQKKGNVVITVR